MTDRKLKRLVKIDRFRRTAQGIGAVAGLITSIATLIMISSGKKDEK